MTPKYEPLQDAIIVCFFSCLFTYLVVSCTSNRQEHNTKEEIEELQNQVSDLEDRIIYLESIVDEQQSTIEDNTSRLDDVEGRVDDLEYNAY